MQTWTVDGREVNAATMRALRDKQEVLLANNSNGKVTNVPKKKTNTSAGKTSAHSETPKNVIPAATTKEAEAPKAKPGPKPKIPEEKPEPKVEIPVKPEPVKTSNSK